MNVTFEFDLLKTILVF